MRQFAPPYIYDMLPATDNYLADYFLDRGVVWSIKCQKMPQKPFFFSPTNNPKLKYINFIIIED